MFLLFFGFLSHFPCFVFLFSDAQAVSLVGLRPPPRFRWVGQHPTFLLRGSTILAPRGMSSSESARDRLRRLRKRGSLSLDEYLREIELLDAEDNAAQARDETGDSDEHLVDERQRLQAVGARGAHRLCHLSKLGIV